MNTNLSVQPFDKGQATCRGCRRVLRGNEYCYGGSAYHPDTGERCPSNYYGGYVCSRACDYRAALELEQSMPGHYHQKTLQANSPAAQRVRSNWSES